MADTTTGPTNSAPLTNTNSVVVRCATCSTLNRVDLGRQKFLDGARVPVLVDFYADWCGPCKAMAPVLDTFARQHAGTVLVLKLNTDTNPATASRFNIASIPTVIVFRNGVESKRQLGAVPRAVLESMLT